MKLHRELNTREEKEFAEWARDNWPFKVGFAWGDEPNPTWHPIVQRECRRMSNEFKCGLQLRTQGMSQQDVADHVHKLREGYNDE